jgi:ATP-dependent DNA ligase
VARWLYEEKCDGWRMVAHKAGDVVRFISRNGRDHTRRFPDLVGAIAELPTATLIVDGEVSIFDQQLVSRFEWLRHGKPPGMAPPPLFMAFDCLVLNWTSAITHSGCGGTFSTGSSTTRRPCCRPGACPVRASRRGSK